MPHHTKGTNSWKRYKKGFKKSVSNTNMGYILINYTSFAIRIDCEQCHIYFKILRNLCFCSEVKFFLYNTLVKRIEKRPGIPKIARVSLDIASTWLPVYMSKISIFKVSAFEAVLGLEGHPKIDWFLVYFKNLNYSSNLNSASVAQWSKAPVETLVVPGSNPRRARISFFIPFSAISPLCVLWWFLNFFLIFRV